MKTKLTEDGLVDMVVREWPENRPGSYLNARILSIRRRALRLLKRVRDAARAESAGAERGFRLLLFSTHGCAGMYGDDGEMQCNQPGCRIDFKRDTPAEIDRKLTERGMRRLAEQIRAVAPKDSAT